MQLLILKLKKFKKSIDNRKTRWYTNQVLRNAPLAQLVRATGS